MVVESMNLNSDAPIDASELMTDSLRGAKLCKLEQPAKDVWAFSFEIAGLTIQCPWRIVTDGGVVLGGCDHDQQFGLPAPVDIMSETLRWLANRIVSAVEVDRVTGDLSVKFSPEAQIQAFNNSGGYEAWSLGTRGGLQVFALGGGKLAIWDKRTKAQH
jgi:hypothetical protein